MNHCTYWCRATTFLFLLLSTSSALSIIAVSRRSSLSVEPQIVTVLFATSSQQQSNELPNLSSLSASLVESSSSSDVEKIITSSSSSSSAESPTTNKIPPKTKTVPCPDCDMCDGSGRILGGIGTVLEWWPIKAYRPCPNFVERGGQYLRAGQGLDEIAFGRDSTFQK